MPLPNLIKTSLVRIFAAAFVYAVLTFVPNISAAQQWLTEVRATTKYARIFYDSDETARLFNKNLRLGTLSHLMKRTDVDVSLNGQISEKVDIIVERVKTMLEMHPKNFKVDIKVVSDAGTIRALYRKKYYRDVEFVAFYSPQERAIYMSADNTKSKILAHELAHAIIDQFFGVAAPVKIHELIADYVDENFD